MFQAYRKKQTTTNWRQQMNRPEGKATGTGISSRYKVYEMVKE